MSLISIHGAYLSFSDAPLLDNTELHIEENERVCLVGRNGAGKSTLMKIIYGEQPLDDGRIIYETDLVVARLQQDPPRNITGSVYDFVAEGVEEQAEHLKAYHAISHVVMEDPSDKNLNEMARLQSILDHQNLWQLESRIHDVLEQIGLQPDTELSSLSGGWLRKAALGRALVETGAADWLGKLFSLGLDSAPPAVAVGALMAFATLLTNFVSNASAAAVCTPIAMSLAANLGAPAEPFVLAVLFGCNLCYATPMAYQTNLIIMTAARYEFRDFVRAGLPLALLMIVVLAVLLVKRYGM